MVIDYILDRKNGSPYNAGDFYRYAMKESNCFNGLFDALIRAMDFGEEEDVRNALKKYIKEQGYNMQICKFIDSVKWLEDDKGQPPKARDFAELSWCDEDIKNALEYLDWEASEDNIDEVYQEIDEEDFVEVMCEAGWHYIYNIICHLSDEGRLKGKGQ